jgi:aspartate/methionine/tyrosine aminotransferase
MDAHETSAKINIAETCCASISVDDLRSLSEDKQTNPIQTSAKLTYGQIRGSVALRTNIANSYHDRSNPTNNSLSSPAAVVDDDAGLPADNVLVTPGAIHANFLLLYTLVSAGDHVICHYPTYQQLYSVPEALGAEVSLWRAPEESGWQLRTEDLRDLLRPNTKLIILKLVIYLSTSFLSCVCWTPTED